MTRFPAAALLAAVLAPAAFGQGRPLDWSFYGGDAQHTNWEKADSRITRENVKDFQLVLKRRLETAKGGLRTLTPPVVIGQLISYRGFKELAFVTGSSDTIWSIDVDTDRIFWQKRFSTAAKSGPCGGATAAAALTPPTNFGARQRPAPGGAAPVNRGVLAAGGFGAPRPAFSVSRDGKLHLLNTSNGDDLLPAIPFLPADSEASSLTIADGAIYTTTTACGGAPAGVWALDLSAVDPKGPASAPPAPATFHGSTSALAIGNDGAVYASTADHPLVALAPRTLALEHSFSGAPGGVVAPVVFTHKDHEFVVTAAHDGSLYLFDSTAFDAPVSKTPVIGTVWGGLSSWQDPAGTRWVLAPVWKSAATGKGAIVAMKLEEQNGKPVLSQAWTSPDMDSPQPPVITAGVVFALASGTGAKSHAVLHAFDALTGSEIYTTGNQVTSPANLTGISIANGRVFFTTGDGTLYAFGVYMER